MILWVDGAHDPAENMRRDAALLAAAERGAPAVLRLFAFRPFGITLGRGQDAARALDLARCAAEGVPWAQRPTGGRAIFHAEEWTFSLAAPLGDERWGGSPAESYASLSALIARALARLGLPVEFARGARRAADEPAAPLAAACFAASARHEITAAGRKLVGIAQRRTRAALLQQGSILLGEGHLRLADYVLGGETERAAVRRNLALVTARAAEWLPRGVSDERWADAVAAELPLGHGLEHGNAGRYLLALPPSDSYTPLDFAS
jgi:lipoate-protein ligase A